MCHTWCCFKCVDICTNLSDIKKKVFETKQEGFDGQRLQCLLLTRIPSAALNSNNNTLSTQTNYLIEAVCREECDLMKYVYPGNVSLRGPVS